MADFYTEWKRLKCPNLAFIALAAFLISGCGEGAKPAAKPKLPTVTVAKPITKTIVEWDAYTGRLEAVDLVEIRARVSGYLMSAEFEEGQIVQKGDLLFVIDPRPFEAELNAAQAKLRQSESQLVQATAMLNEAKARMVQSDSKLKLAKTKDRRMQSLGKSSAVSQEEMDESGAELDQAKADIDGGQAGIRSAEAAIATAKAEIGVATAGVETAKLNLEYTNVRAPVTGRISQKYITEGNLIAGGSATSSMLTMITSLDPIYCVFDADEQAVLKYLRLAAAGKRESSRDTENPVFMELADETGFPHKGKIDFVDNRFDPATASMRARCVFENKDRLLLPGMFARIRIPGSAPRETVLIPDSAIGTDQSSQYVYVVVDDVIKRRSIVPGPITDGLRVIREGLKGDEMLVTQGLLQARPDAKVKTVPGKIETVEDGLPNEYTAVPSKQQVELRASAPQDDQKSPNSP